MTITATMVKELRDKTGAGMMDAKKALVETNGDMEKAMEFLRQKGMASADKKMGRIAAEGTIASIIDGKKGAMIEVNCETDFVAKNEDFKEFANMMAKAVLELNPATVDEMLTKECPVCKKPIEEVIKEKAFACEKVAEAVAGKQIVKTIVVPVAASLIACTNEVSSFTFIVFELFANITPGINNKIIKNIILK